MPKYLPLPDGNSLEVPDNVSYEQAIARAKERFPKLYGIEAPDTGFMSAIGAGLKGGLGSTAQGIGEVTGLEGLADYGRRMQESAAKTYRPTTEQDIADARVKGLLPEAGAYLSKYLTEPVGEATGNIAGRYGLPTIAGIGAAALAPEAALGASAAEIAAATAARNTLSGVGFAGANAPIHIGENVAAQKRLGQEPDYAAATAAGIAQTAIDSLAGAIFNTPLKGVLGKTAQEEAQALAPKVLAGELTAQEASKQVSGTLKNIAQGTAQNAVVGTGMMVGNEALTRAATGQSLTSPEAQEAYLQNLKMGVGMSPLFGALHGLGARGAAETTLKNAAIEGEAARAKQQQETAQEPAEHPEYIQKVKNEYESAWEKYTQMRDALGKTPGKDEPPHLALEHQEKKDALAAQRQVVEDLAPEYHRIQKILKEQEVPEGEQKLLGYTPNDIALPGITPKAEAAPNVLDMMDEHKRMLEKKAEIEQRMHEAAPEEFADLHNAYEGLNHRLNLSENAIKEAGGVLAEPSEFEALATKQVSALDKRIKATETLYNKAKDPEIGDFAAARKHAETLAKLKQQKQDLLELHDQQRLQVEQQATGKGETLPMFSQKETPPVVAQTPEEATSFLQPEAEEPAKRDTKQKVLFSPKNIKETTARNEESQRRLDQQAKTEETLRNGTVEDVANFFKEETPQNVPTKETVTPEAVKEAASMPEMRALAHAEGIKSPEHKAFMKERNAQIAALRNNGDVQGANNLRAQTTYEAYNKAVEFGKETPKYKDGVAKTAVKVQAENAKNPKKVPPKKTDEDFEFSRGKAEDPHTVDSLKEELNKAMGMPVTGPGKGKKLTILPSPEALNVEGIPADAKGVVLPDGKAYLFAKNINKGEGLSVLLHEVGTHLGFRNFFNEAQYNRLYDVVKTWEAKNDDSIESRVARAARERVKAAETNPDQVKDEMLAYTVEEAIKAGIDPSGTKKGGVLQEWMNTVVNAFRNALEKFGAKSFGLIPKKLTAQDLVDFAYGAAHLELNGGWHGSKKAFSEFNHEYMGSGAGAQAYGYGTYTAENRRLADEIHNKGALFRTMRTRPEEHYINWNTLLESQSPYVKEKLLTLFQSLNKQQKAAFNKSLNQMPEGRRTGLHIIGAVEAAMEAGGAEPEVAQQLAANFMHAHGIAGSVHKDNVSHNLFQSPGYRNFVDFGDKEHGPQIVGTDIQPIGPANKPLFSRKADYGTDNPLSRLTQKVIAQKPTLKEKIGDMSALAAETELVDMRAALRKAVNVGAEAINKPNVATQVISHIIRGDDKVQMAMSVLGKGPLEMYTDEKGIKGVQSSGKNSGLDVFKAVSAIPEGNAQGKTDMATAYLIAARALNKGLKKLDLGELGLSEKDLKDTMAYVDSRPAMKAALEDVRAKYNAYNEGQIKFLAETGAISNKVADQLLKDKDYVPFYRVDANGQAKLVFNDNVMVNVGDIKNQPYLHSLKGGETKILPLDQSMLQNTLLLTDKGLTNLTQKSIAYAFQEIGNARPGGGKNDMVVHIGKGPADKNVLRFTQEPDPKDPKDTGERWIKIDTKGTVMEGVPNAMIMKSIEGTALSLPAYLKLAGDASDLLRSGVTRTPLYLAHQLLRDPIAAVATGGVAKNPLMAVLAAGKNFIQMQRGKSDVGAELIRKGILHSNIFKGDSSDISKFALQLASGKDQNAIQWLVAKADQMALNADASTRALVYQSAREKGLSQVEAEVAAREVVNYQKRGLSASVQHANRMVPFMNGQTQALNSFFKAARGNMPYNEQLNIKKKFYNTALTLAGAGLAYGFALADNPYYKNATLQDKYNNMFVFLPGIEEPIKIPVPYEVGYFFSLGAAAADAINGTAQTKDQAAALAKLFSSSIPGYSSKGVPQLVKPVAEAALNMDLNYMQPIESARLQNLDPEQRFNANTTELAKQLSHYTGGIISPLKMEHIVKGYLGQLPLAAAGAANDLFRPGNEKPEARITEAPLIGSAFQKKFGGGDENIAYSDAQDAIKARNTLNSMLKDGRIPEAKEFMEENKKRLLLAQGATQFQNTMAQFAAQARMIQNARNMSPDQKRAKLDQLDEVKQKISANFRKMAERV